jgi:serine/threonine protein phosphatase PrpC
MLKNETNNIVEENGNKFKRNSRKNIKSRNLNDIFRNKKDNINKNTINLNTLYRRRKSRIEIDANKPKKIEKNQEIKNNNYTENINALSNRVNKINNKSNYNSFDGRKNKLKNINKKDILQKFEDEKNNKNINEIKENVVKKNISIFNDNKNININQNEKINQNKDNKDNKNKENKIQENEKSPLKNDIPLLQLTDINSSSSSLQNNDKIKKNISSEDVTETSYDSDNGIEIKGEFLSKQEKTSLLNNMKKCLFKQTLDLNKPQIFIPNKLNNINLKENISIAESQIIENNETKINSHFITKAGTDDKKEKINQDSYLLFPNIFDNLLNIFGIFDGHGKNGHLISSFVSKFLSQYLTNKKNYIHKKSDESYSDSDSDSDISEKEILINKDLLSNLFLEENFNFIKNIIQEIDMKVNECNFDIQLSGTTCLLLFIFNNQIICSNIGDSQCFLYHCSNEDRWTHEQLSIIHKPDIDSEKERIISYGGVIHPYYDENGLYEGPNRVYEKGKPYPGLSLTRSIGDLEAQKIGIISEPDIIIKKIDSTCKYIVLGSDGLWDMITPYDVGRIVNPFFSKNDIKGATQALLKKASKNWDKDGSDRDDITIIVAFIGKPNEN